MPTEIMPVILELADPNGPFGARGVAEMPLVPFTPAIAAAIHDAVRRLGDRAADDPGAGAGRARHAVPRCAQRTN